MPTIGTQADVLRAVGRLVDDRRVGPVSISTDEAFLTVSWPRGDEAAYQEFDPGLLRAQARAMRQGAGGPAGSPRSELLRTLGQELDRGGIELIQVAERPDGFFVWGTAHGRSVERVYSTGELAELSARRRALRGHGHSTGPS
jgi:hypothetical protein